MAMATATTLTLCVWAKRQYYWNVFAWLAAKYLEMHIEFELEHGVNRHVSAAPHSSNFGVRVLDQPTITLVWHSMAQEGGGGKRIGRLTTGLLLFCHLLWYHHSVAPAHVPSGTCPGVLLHKWTFVFKRSVRISQQMALDASVEKWSNIWKVNRIVWVNSWSAQ